MNRYSLDPADIQDPPTTLAGCLKHLGPGFILTASIVGSGELIATTALGAEAGFITLWVVLLSCLVKVMLQIEFGRHAIHSAEPTLASFDRLPGPRIGKANWSIWTWWTLMFAKALQVGGLVGGFGGVMHMVLPQFSILTWAIAGAVSAALIVQSGSYAWIEKSSLVLIGLFTLLTLACVFALQGTPYAITTDELASGLTFQLPASLVFVALGAFGITGVGGDEIMAYNYWLIEKGYARKVGAKPAVMDEAWLRRARGWMRVMYFDAFASMVVYTVVTAAFYVLGAGVLHVMGVRPAGAAIVEQISLMYVATLGPWARVAFLIGAFAVLYSTILSALGAWTRLFTDATARVGVFSFEDQRAWKRWVAAYSWLVPALWTTSFILIGEPRSMIIIGGFITSIILLLVVFAAIQFRYRRLPAELKPGRLYDSALWVSIAAVLGLAIYSVFKVLS
jgi:manganese transport protein